MKKLKVGIIGLGTIGAVHAESYQAHPAEVEVTALCDVAEKRLKEQGKKWNVSQCFTDYRDLLKTDVDAVSICVGNALHRETAIRALEAGKHVLLEKPMAMNAKEAADIVKASEKARKVLQIAMVWRQATEAQYARQLVTNGTLGKVYHLRMVLIRRRGIPGMGGWFTTKSMSGGGPLIDIGVHFFDSAMYISGQWKPLSVSAMTHASFGTPMRNYRYVGMWAGPPKYDGVFDVEDSAEGMVRFSKQVSMSFEVAWAANAEDEMYLEILGDRGGLRVFDGKAPRLLTEHEGRIVDIHPKFPSEGNRYYSQAATFLAACRRERPPFATGKEGLEVMKLIDAIYRSSETGKEVQINR
jgi:predicted dehydrogenase